jgi:hypothetical protein
MRESLLVLRYAAASGFADFSTIYTWRTWTVGWLSRAICGVQVPTGFWPEWVRAVAGGLPLTHGLAAVRSALAGAGPGEVLPAVGAEIALAAGWLVLAVLAFNRLTERGRRDGSIEFGD